MPEIRRLIARFQLTVGLCLDLILQWSVWRRIHQAVAKRCHYKRRGYEGQKSGQSQRVDYAGETSRTNTLPSQVVPYNAKVVQNFQEKLRAKYMAELPEICQFSAYIVFNLPA